MKADSKTETEIMTVLSELSDAYGRGDYRRVSALYVEGEGAVAIGPGFGDKWVGARAIAEAYEREFKHFPGSDLEFTWVSISGRDQVAWISSECTTHVRVDNKVLLLNGRFTAVFERQEGRWLIATSHLSLPSLM